MFKSMENVFKLGQRVTMKPSTTMSFRYHEVLLKAVPSRNSSCYSKGTRFPAHSPWRAFSPTWSSHKIHSSRFTSESSHWTYPLVGRWFLFGSSLIFGIVVVGGITRLTESRLSITEWNAIRGLKWPGNESKWQEEFEKYKNSPEYQLMNSNMTLFEFKRIYYWEWLHRNLGRTIGLVFLLPSIYFTVTKPSLSRIQKFQSTTGLSIQQLSQWMSPTVKRTAWTCCVLVGFQGALGWYMVKSGLETDILETPHATPRVSQYRLAAHLGSAFVIYLLSTWHGLQILHGAKAIHPLAASKVVDGTLVRFFRATKWVSGLTFVTAMSGAFVAGLDAGLVYNTWPKMGERFFPDFQELFPQVLSTTNNGHARVAAKALASDPLEGILQFFNEKRYRNFFENPVTAQLDHRLLAYTTFSGISGLWLWSRRLRLPAPVQNAVHLMMGVALAQVALGITTLLYLVPLELAASHQACSLVLLTSSTYLLQKLKQHIK